MEELTCEVTGRKFYISKKERSLYSRFDLPLPTRSPEERLRNLLVFHNDHKFFWRTCSNTGERIYSSYAPDAPFPVVGIEQWLHGSSGGTEFGQNYDPQVPFFVELLHLWRTVPRPATSLRNILASLASGVTFSERDSFLVFDVNKISHCYYSVSIEDSSYCADCYFCENCHWCYECIDCYKCTELRWSEHCNSCESSAFLSGCVNCKSCLFCTNLENKEYYVFNEYVGEQRYQEILADRSFSFRQSVDNAKGEFQKFSSSLPVPHIYASNSRKCTGNYLRNCKNVIDSFECNDGSNLVHCCRLTRAENCLEGYGFGQGLENSAQFVSCGMNASNIVQSIECWNNVHNLRYCTFCEDSSHLFGCVGLRGKEYCILNKQYSKSEYEALLGKIKDDLINSGDWGKTLPQTFSGFAYNHSSANEYMPLNAARAQLMGFRWNESFEIIKPSQLLQGITESPEERFQELPEFIGDIDSANIKDALFLCELTGKPFQITPEELELYKKLNIPPPARSFEQRHAERLMKMTPRQMTERKSDKSGVDLYTAFPNRWSRPVYEEKEWQKYVKKANKN